MRIALLSFLTFILSTTIFAQNKNAVKLYRYYNIPAKGHFYTINFAELGNGNASFKFEGVAAYVFQSQVEETFPVYRYYNNKTKTHFYTANFEELRNGNATFKYEGVAFYIYKNEMPGTHPFYRYYHTTGQYHFYTASFTELGSGKNGYVMEGNIGYVYATEEAANAAANKKAEAEVEKIMAATNSKPVLSPDDRARHVLTVLYLAYEAWNSSNTDYREPLDYFKDVSSGRIAGRLYLTPVNNERYSPINLTWQNDNIWWGTLYNSNFSINWADERVSRLKVESLSDFDYTIKYDSTGKLVGFVCVKLINGSIQIVKDIVVDGERIIKVTGYENPVNGTPWIRSVKTYSYADKETTVDGLIYKTGKPNTQQNVMPAASSTYKTLDDNSYITKTGWGAIIETKYNSADLISFKKVTQNTSTEEHNYEYIDKKMFRETTVEVKNGEFAQKTIQLYFDLENASASASIYEKTRGLYKFDKSGDLIWEARDSKYREKKDGVWSDWKFFKY